MRGQWRLLLLRLCFSLPLSLCDPPTNLHIHLPRRAVRPPSLLADAALTSRAHSPGSIEAGELSPNVSPSSSFPLSRRKWARLLVAYLLWFFFPLSGAHLLYLGRNRAALISSVSCGFFGLGWLADAFRIPGYEAELASASLLSSSHPHTTTPPSRPRRSRLGRVTTLCTQLLLSLWFFYHASRLLSPTASPHLAASLGGGSAAIAVWLTTATGGLPLLPSSMLALIHLAAASVASVGASALLSVDWPDPALASAQPSLRLQPGVLPLLVGVGVANLVGGMGNPVKESERSWAPRRSWGTCSMVFLGSVLFWLAVLAGWLMRVPTEVSVDGRLTTIDAWQLVSASSCVLRPDRLYTCLRQGLREPACLKRHLVQLLGPFHRFCIMPQHVNKCFDWDIFDTRWMRVGLSLKEAYQALNVKPGASIREIKMAHHRIALANHPDKVKNFGTADAMEAADKFMKVQRAFETIMENRKPRQTASSRARE